jgi:hypothetical protein
VFNRVGDSRIVSGERYEYGLLRQRSNAKKATHPRKERTIRSGDPVPWKAKCMLQAVAWTSKTTVSENCKIVVREREGAGDRSFEQSRM